VQDNKHPQGHVEYARSSIASANGGIHMTLTPPRLLHDSLCGGCRYSHVPTTWRSGICARRITSLMKRDKNRMLAQAGALWSGEKIPKIAVAAFRMPAAIVPRNTGALMMQDHELTSADRIWFLPFRLSTDFRRKRSNPIT
jgi:hypothetical protein